MEPFEISIVTLKPLNSRKQCTLPYLIFTSNNENPICPATSVAG